MEYYVSTDKEQLDIKVVYGYLNRESYWAKGRSLALIKKSIEHSLCYGVYTSKNEQVGFARVITDYSTFAYLADVFILPSYQGKGLGKLLMAEIMKYPDFVNIRKFMLATQDAHGLYTQYGFEPLVRPQNVLERRYKN